MEATQAASAASKLIRATCAPLFREPDPESEHVSQAVLGQAVEVLQGERTWRRVRTPDRYEGWLDATALVDAPDGWGGPWAEVTDLFANLRGGAHFQRAALLQAPLGARLPLVERVSLAEPPCADSQGWVQLLLPDGRRVWTEAKRVRDVEQDPERPATPEAICGTARRLLGVPYLWGGCTPFGIDCSGFVQLVMGLHGIRLLRDAGPQMTQGAPSPAPDAADLVFFGPPDQPERITHVGMMLDRERFIHAAGSDCVRINRLEDPPYGRLFRGARRVVSRP
jgi:hypothetical protein